MGKKFPCERAIYRGKNIWGMPDNISVSLVMAALYSRCVHYILHLQQWFPSFFFLSFYPRLMSAVGGWMSTILPHMIWP